MSIYKSYLQQFWNGEYDQDFLHWLFSTPNRSIMLIDGESRPVYGVSFDREYVLVHTSPYKIFKVINRYFTSRDLYYFKAVDLIGKEYLFLEGGSIQQVESVNGLIDFKPEYYEWWKK
jgi:hypothetical protein